MLLKGRSTGLDCVSRVKQLNSLKEVRNAFVSLGRPMKFAYWMAETVLQVLLLMNWPREEWLSLLHQYESPIKLR